MKVQLSFDEETMNSRFTPTSIPVKPPRVTKFEFMARDAETAKGPAARPRASDT